jgi:hypothetical protein
MVSFRFLLIFVMIFTSHVNSALIDQKNFQVRMLTSVNQIRSKYQNTPAVVASDELTISAQEYSDLLAQINTGVSRNENSLKTCGDRMKRYTIDTQITTGMAACGETLALIYSSQDLKEACNPETFVQLWNSQRLFYNYTFPPNNSLDQTRFSEFTQLVW